MQYTCTSIQTGTLPCHITRTSDLVMEGNKFSKKQEKPFSIGNTLLFSLILTYLYFLELKRTKTVGLYFKHKWNLQIEVKEINVTVLSQVSQIWERIISLIISFFHSMKPNGKQYEAQSTNILYSFYI